MVGPAPCPNVSLAFLCLNRLKRVLGKRLREILVLWEQGNHVDLVWFAIVEQREALAQPFLR